MVISTTSVIDHEFQNELCENGFNPPKNVEEDLVMTENRKELILIFFLCDIFAGTVWTACAHIVTTSVGAGVLSLAWAMAQLGWLGGISILLFCTIGALYAATRLADCYRFPDPVTGKRNYSYMEAVKAYLAGTIYKFCGWMIYLNLATIGVGFTITTKSNCHRKNGGDDPCKFSNIPHVIGFGIVEIFLSQLPNFHKLSWLSKLAAIMSFNSAAYGGKTSLAGVDLPLSEKFWRTFAAAGDMAFACSYALVLLDIQDTLKSSPPENKVMKKAVSIRGLPSGSLIRTANVFIVVHIVGAYQAVMEDSLWSVGLISCHSSAIVLRHAGLLGALGYWPLIVIPMEMHIVQNKIAKGTIRWFELQLLSLLCLILSLAAASGAIHGLYKGLKAYKAFQIKE
ncbi:unnamed protein product [Malus baccata var. baccata]